MCVILAHLWAPNKQKEAMAQSLSLLSIGIWTKLSHIK